MKAIEESDGSLRLEYAGLARGEDPSLDEAVAAIAAKHAATMADAPAKPATPTTPAPPTARTDEPSSRLTP